LRATYLAKDKFSDDEEDLLAEMLQKVRKQSTMSQKATAAQNRMDERIKTNLLDGTEAAVDSRVDKIVAEGGAERWASR